MTFAEAVGTCLSKYADFDGRARRAEYWWFVLFSILGQLVLAVLDAIVLRGAQILPTLFVLALFLPALAVGARRLHDRDMSAWWLLLWLVPVIGPLLLLILFILPGTPGRNRFGPDPLGGRRGQEDEDEADYAPTSIPRVPRR